MINSLKSGESIELLTHKDNEPIGLFVPMNNAKSNKRTLGLLEGNGQILIKDNFKITEEELIGMQ